MVHSSLNDVEQDGKVGDSGWLENGELGVVPEVRRKQMDIGQVGSVPAVLWVSASIRVIMRAKGDADQPVEDDKLAW